jgi:His/Glu/Gln/Arg/opine family amino acid ABC transporter permease subunit
MPFDVVTRNLELLGSGLVLTIVVSVASIMAGMVLGLATAVARMSSVAPFRAVAGAYVELIRNTPILVQILLIYLGLPEFGIRLSALESVLIALSVNNGAYLGEIIRGGLQSVPKGQLEAAAAIGLGRRTTLQEIMVPQALRSIIPALTNQFILAILASSLGSIIGAPELTEQVLFIDSRAYRTIELLIFLTLTYAALTLIVARLSRMVTNRLDRAYLR